MRLRRNLIISQVVAVAILLCILIFSILVFFRTTLPLIETGLETKARSCAETLAALVDVGIAADDRVTLLNALRRCSHPGSMPDPDLKSVAIVDTNGNILASLGKVPKGLPDPPTAVVTVAQRLPGVYRAVAQVAIEGTVLGGVWAEYHTNRVKEARNSFVFSHSVGLVAILIACILSILFAFHLVKPLRKMISFVHVVAKGNLTARLSVKASDELGVLADDLNHMADELQHRHTVEEAVFKASRMFLDPGETSRDEALAVLGQAVSSDWAYLFKQTDDEKLNVVNLWCHPGTEHRLRENLPAVNIADFSWSMEKLHKGEVIVIPDTGALPSPADAEKNLIQSRGVGSLLIVPICPRGGILSGVMVFCNNQKRSTWPQADVQAMGVIAELLSTYWEREKAEEETRASEERFRMLFELAPDAYFLNDLEGRFVDANKAAEIVTGYSRDELLGKTYWDLNMLVEEDIPMVLEATKRRSQENSVEIDELSYRRKDGSIVKADIHSFPIKLRDQDLVLTSSRDVTQRFQAEQERVELEKRMRQLQKMEAVGRLAGGVAHEINNPLGVILGFSQAISERIEDDDPLSMPLRSIERETLRCKSLVADLLAFSRKSTEKPSQVDVCKLIESTRKLVTNQARLHSIEVIADCAGNLPEIMADFNRLEQVLVNLSTNAFDAMPKGGILKFEAHNSDSNVIIRVIDTGTGMSPEVRERIFEPFFTTKEVGKGTGLGLSLAYEIVTQHGGSIECQSEIGKGATFTATFPANGS